jgi:hypothetical protein
MNTGVADSRLICLRYPATCHCCATPLGARTRAWWSTAERAATCTNCRSVTEPAAASPAVLVGEAGGSAQREWERRTTRREEQIRAQHPRLGGLILALQNDPQSTTAWARGSEGERLLGRHLDRLRRPDVAVLHDRRIPGSRANIDHLVIAPSGIFVIDAKRYAGKVELRDRGGSFRPDIRLYVGGRDRTAVVAGMQRQLDVVQRTLADVAEAKDAAVNSVLCFIGTEWSVFARPIRIAGTTVTWPKALSKQIEQAGELAADRVQELAQRLGQALPPA